MKTEPYRNRGFFLKTEPKSTDLAKCETVTTLQLHNNLSKSGEATSLCIKNKNTMNYINTPSYTVLVIVTNLQLTYLVTYTRVLTTDQMQPVLKV